MKPASPPRPPSELVRIATRLHHALLRHCGEPVEVEALLASAALAREAVWVAVASGDAQLAALGRQFEQALAARAEPAAPQDAAWSQDTSGFGLTRPPEAGEPRRTRASTPVWRRPVEWLRRSGHSTR